MLRLNYQHLRYFWVVAREGSVVRAARSLGLAAPTITGQVRQIEKALGERLFERVGRGLVLTACGRVAFDYAERIFSLGEELATALDGNGGASPVPLRIGIADVVPKTLVATALRSVFEGRDSVRLVCREGGCVEEYLDALVARRLDLVFADAPAPPERSRVFNHRLAEYETTVFGSPVLATRHRKAFPHSLHGARFVVAGDRSARRRRLEQWCEKRGIEPEIVAEIDDAALIMELGSRGGVLFIGPSLLEHQICSRYGVRAIGRLTGLRHELYAISAKGGLRHPAIRAACEAICQQDILGE